jgi:hypothetical protein
MEAPRRQLIQLTRRAGIGGGGALTLTLALALALTLAVTGCGGSSSSTSTTAAPAGGVAGGDGGFTTVIPTTFVNGLAARSGGPVNHLPARAAARGVDYRKGPVGGPQLPQYQVFALHGGKIYMVTYTALSFRYGASLPAMQQVLAGWRWK